MLAGLLDNPDLTMGELMRMKKNYSQLNQVTDSNCTQYLQKLTPLRLATQWDAERYTWRNNEDKDVQLVFFVDS
jgi:hypothetical protein